MTKKKSKQPNTTYICWSCDINSRHCYVIAAMDVLLRNTSFKSKFEQIFSLKSIIIVTITLVRLKILKILKMSIPPLELELPSDGGQPAASAPSSSTRTSSRGETRWRWPSSVFCFERSFFTFNEFGNLV